MAATPTTVAPCAESAQSANLKRLRFGIVGAGRVTARHIQALAKQNNVDLVAVADPRLEAARNLVAGCDAEAMDDGQALLERPDVDAVFICTPHYLHAPYAVTALRSGKHVFIEKPMANTPEECESINRAASESGCLVAIGHHQRFLPLFRRAREVVLSGRIGTVRQITDQLIINGGWETRSDWWKKKALAGGGLLMNFGVHQIDRTLWLAGDSPSAVSAVIQCGLPEVEVDTDYSLLVTTSRGIALSIQGAGYRCRPEHRFEVVGDQGRLWLDITGEKLLCAGSSDPKDLTEEHVPGYFEAVEEMVEGFVTAIRTGEKPVVDGLWGEQVVRVAHLAYEAAETRKTVHFPDGI